MVTFSPPKAPTVGSQRRTTARILEAQFGDGYSQRAGDGLNSVEDAFSLVWNALSEAEADTITDFFEARGGWEAFDWTPPGEVAARKFRCGEWTRDWDGAMRRVTANFAEVFDL